MTNYIVGLTGGIGSGKTTVANLFAEKGITVIDTDQLARDLTSKGELALEKISRQFGSSILLTDGTLDRSSLRKRVFAEPADRLWLEQLLHPLIRNAMKQQAQESSSPYCIVVIPLLFETTPNPLINRVLVVDTHENNQIIRAKIRDNANENMITTIVKTQISREDRLKKADDVIYNDGELADLLPQVDKFHQLYLNLAK